MSAARMDMKDAGRAVRPLHFVFWGGVLGILVLPRWLIFVVPLTWWRQVYRALLLVSAAGAAPLSVGAFWLARIHVSRRYRVAMSFAGAAFALRAAASLLVGAFMPNPYLDTAIGILHPCNVVWMAAAVALCLGMRWFVEEADLTAALLEWRLTVRLAASALVVVAATNVFSMAARLTRPSWASSGHLVCAEIAAILFSGILCVYFLLSTHLTLKTIMLFQGEHESEGG